MCRRSLGQVSSDWYPIAYELKLIVVALLIGAIARPGRLSPVPGLAEDRSWRLDRPLRLPAWVGLDGHYPALPFLGGSRSAFDP